MTRSVSCFLVLVSSSVFGQNILPEYKPFGEDSSLKVWGFGQTLYSRIDSEPDTFLWKNLNLLSDLRFGKWSQRTRIDVVGFEPSRDNWLHYSYFEYATEEDWKLRVGRIFLAQGYITPPVFKLETIHYPASTSGAYRLYAYGVQAEKRWTNGWRLLVDGSGDSSVPYDSRKSWQKAEGSLRLTKDFSETTSSGITATVTEDDVRGGLDFEWRPRTDLYLKGATVASHAFTGNEFFGGYVFAGYKPLPWLELHAQVDGGKDISEEMSPPFTTGVLGGRLLDVKDRLSLTVDYEYDLLDGKEVGLFARVQFRF